MRIALSGSSPLSACGARCQDEGVGRQANSGRPFPTRNIVLSQALHCNRTLQNASLGGRESVQQRRSSKGRSTHRSSNAVAGPFFGTLKKELHYEFPLQSHSPPRTAVANYIESFYAERVECLAVCGRFENRFLEPIPRKIENSNAGDFQVRRRANGEGRNVADSADREDLSQKGLLLRKTPGPLGEEGPVAHPGLLEIGAEAIELLGAGLVTAIAEPKGKGQFALQATFENMRRECEFEFGIKGVSCAGQGQAARRMAQAVGGLQSEWLRTRTMMLRRDRTCVNPQRRPASALPGILEEQPGALRMPGHPVLNSVLPRPRR